MMFQPHAHHVLWFLGTVLMLWAVSLVARGMFSRPPSVGGKRGPRVVRRGVVAGGMLLVVVSAGVMFCAAMFQKWMFGDDVVEEGFTVYHAIAIGIGVFAVSLAAWGWFADRSKGRQRCPKCWYEMDAVASTGKLICPECGHDARTAARLLKTRRSWKTVAIAGVLAIVAAFTPRAALVQRDGWKALMPTTVMISMMWRLPDSWITDPRGVNRGTLEERFGRDAYEWQKSWVESKLRGEIEHPTSMANIDRALTLAQWGFDPNRPEVVLGVIEFCVDSLGSTDLSERGRAAEIFDTLRRPPHAGFSDSDIADRCRKQVSQAAHGLADTRNEVVLAAATVLAMAGAETDGMVGAIERLVASSTAPVRASDWFRTAEPVAIAMPNSPRAEKLLLDWVKNGAEPQQLGAWVAALRYGGDRLPDSFVREADDQLRSTLSLSVARVVGRYRLQSGEHRAPLFDHLTAVASERGPRRAAAMMALESAPEADVADKLRPIVRDAVFDPDLVVIGQAIQWIRQRLSSEVPEVEYIVEIEHLLGHEDERVRSEAESLLIDLRHAQSRLGIPEIPEWLARPVPSDVLE